MDYKIVVDSSVDSILESKVALSIVPFRIAIDGREFIDDENFNKQEFIDEMVASKNPIRTACAPPYEYEEALKGAKEAFIITISEKVSGSHQSAVIGAQTYMENNPGTRVHVFDSKSATAGHTVVVIRLLELIKKGMNFDEIVSNLTNFIDNELKTYVLLERFDNLIKNGRIKKPAGLLVNLLGVKPVLYAPNGNIELLEMNRGVKKAINSIIEHIRKDTNRHEDSTIVIAHVNALERAELLRDRIKSEFSFKEIRVVPTRGLASGYADVGGVVIGY